MDRRRLFRKPSTRLLFKRVFFISWGAACLGLALWAWTVRNPLLLLWAFAPLLIPAGIWLVSYFLVLLHELGHALIGGMLGFPVSGIEIGPFPHVEFRFRKFAFRLGRFPGGGRTLLGFSYKSQSPWRRFCFLLGGFVFEALFFAAVLIGFRSHPWICVLAVLLCLDQVVVNFIPRYENDLPVNDGASLLSLIGI